MPRTLTGAVTGATGYVGSVIVRELNHAGMAAIALSRPHPGRPESETQRAFSLAVEPARELFRGVDALVHCAYDFTAWGWPAIFDTNVRTTLRLFEIARSVGVKRLLFISSMSAFEGCRSWYGQAKLAVEREAARLGLVVVRPGLVYGDQNGGMVGSLQSLVRWLPVVPLVGGGRQKQYMVHNQDLGRLVTQLCMIDAPPIARPIVAAYPEPLTFREMLTRLAERQGRRPGFVSVSPGLVVWPLRMAEVLGLRLRMRSDGLTGLLEPDPSPDFAAARELGALFRPFV